MLPKNPTLTLLLCILWLFYQLLPALLIEKTCLVGILMDTHLFITGNLVCYRLQLFNAFGFKLFQDKTLHKRYRK